MTDAQIQEKLKADGYTNVQITEHDKDHVDVKATKNGKTEKLAVNPQTGAVTPDTDNDRRSGGTARQTLFGGFRRGGALG